MHRLGVMLLGVGLAAAACAGSSPSASPPAPTSSSGLARDAQIRGPIGLAIDRIGNLYVSQCSSSAGTAFVDRIDASNLLTRVAGTGVEGFSGDGGPAVSATVACPAGLAFGPDGLLYLADHANNRIRRITADGTIETIAGSGPAGINQGSFSGDGHAAALATLQEPWGIAFDSKGNLYVADRDNNRVRRVDPTGLITTVAGNGVRGYAGDGGPATSAQLCGPDGLAVDAHDNVYVADDCNNRVRRIGADGTITTVAGTGTGGNTGDGGPATTAQIDGPDGLAFDAGGNLFIATNPGLTIRRVDAKGRITTMAGSGAAGVPVDGLSATEASFPELYGLAFDPAGNLYVADGNTSVYRIDPAGIVMRFAGAP